MPEAEIIKADRHLLVRGIDVPPTPGVNGCGSQALAATIAHAEGNEDAELIAEELPWHDRGATPVDLLLAARARGLQARIERGSLQSLRANIESGIPPLVMLDAGLEVRGVLFRYPTIDVMHWAIVSGVAKDESSILLAGEERRHYIASMNDFDRRWAKSDYCMIVIEGNHAANAAVPNTTLSVR